MMFDQVLSIGVAFDGVYNITTDEIIAQKLIEGDDNSIVGYNLPGSNVRMWKIKTAPLRITERGKIIEFFRHSAVNYMESAFDWTPIGDTAATTLNSAGTNPDRNLGGYFKVRLVKKWTDRRTGNGFHVLTFTIREEV